MPSTPSPCRPCPDNKYCCTRTPSRWLEDMDCLPPNHHECALPSRSTNPRPSVVRDAPARNRIFLRVTQCAQGDQRVQHRWKHRCEPIAAFADAFKHPPLRFFERTPAQRAKPKWMQEFQNIFNAEKEIAPRPELFAARKPQIALLCADRIELVQLLFARQNASWFEMIDDGQGHKHGPAPRRHFVNVKRRPARQEHHFCRDRRQILP